MRKVLERKPEAERGARWEKGGRAGGFQAGGWAPPTSGLCVQRWARLGQREVLRAEPGQEKGLGTGDRGSGIGRAWLVSGKFSAKQF